MVRLKAVWKRACWFCAGLFQFQYGSIKRTAVVAIIAALYSFNSNMVRLKVLLIFRFVAPMGMFQFQYGSIKRGFLFFALPFNEVFQFQYGSIKSSVIDIINTSMPSFNSNMVRLKVCWHRLHC